MNGDPLWMGLHGWGGLVVQEHCLSRSPQPLAQLSPTSFSPVLQQALNTDIYADGQKQRPHKVRGGFINICCAKNKEQVREMAYSV